MNTQPVDIAKAETVPHAHYMRPLDGLRGLACMIVILAHVAQGLKLSFIPQADNLGPVGVALFFTLSGFLMSSLYISENFTFDKVTKYAIARFTRIAPAYWIAVMCAWGIYMFVPDFSYKMTPFIMLRSFFFGSNQGTFWSIPPEVQFYVFFVFIWFSYFTFKTDKNYLWLVVMAIISVAFIATRTEWGGLMLPSKFHMFFFGALAAFLIKNDKSKRFLGSSTTQIIIVFVTIIFGYFFCKNGHVYYSETKKEFLSASFVYTNIAFAAFVALTIASLSQSTFFTKPLETGTMRMMGAASFSIYLFHEMILHLLIKFGYLPPHASFPGIACAVVASLVLPVTFHYAVERHLNRFSKEKCLVLLEKFKAWQSQRKSAVPN